MSDPVTRLSASPGRRVFGVAVLAALSVLILWLALVVPNAPLWRLGMAVLGALVGASARAMWIGTRAAVDLREDGLFLSDGRPLAPMAEIAGVDRGMFVLKPSNGFVVRLTRAPGPAWIPGLYWRIGRRLGVGGITDAAAARAMADMLAARLAERGD